MWKLDTKLSLNGPDILSNPVFTYNFGNCTIAAVYDMSIIFQAMVSEIEKVGFDVMRWSEQVLNNKNGE